MRRLTGSITVFLSLVFLLVFALFGTLLETARYTVCKNHAARTLRTGAEGLLSEYNRPLYEHYGLFFIEKGGTPYEQVIGRYAGDTISAADKGEMDFLDGGIDDIQVKNKVYLGDNHAEALQKQIRSYMGRVVTKEQLQKVLHSSNDLKKVEKSAKNIETTVENQKKAAECYTDLLELMRLVDGITVAGGTIICEQEFAKMFVTGECKGQNFGVTEGAVWKQMKKNLDQSTKDWNIKNKLKFLAKVSKVKGRIKQAQKIGEKLKNGSASKDDTISRVIAALPVLKTNLDILTKTEEILQKDSVKNCKKRLEKLWQDYAFLYFLGVYFSLFFFFAISIPISIALKIDSIASGEAGSPSNISPSWDVSLSLVCCRISSICFESLLLSSAEEDFFSTKSDFSIPK